MPKIIKNKIIYDAEDWLAGLDPINTSIGVNAKIGNGFATMQGLDPLRNLGYITLGLAATDSTNIDQITSALTNGVVYRDSAYMIGGGLVHKMTGITGAGTINKTNPFPWTINHAHASETASDCVNYYVGTTLYLFYSFHDATDWDVGAYGYAADTFNDDYMSTLPETPLAGTDLTDGKSIPHPLIVGDDDILYMGSGRYVHAFDGQKLDVDTDGKFYPKVLTLPLGWNITCFAKINGRLAIGAYYTSSSVDSTYNRGEAKVFTWNYLDLDIENYYTLNDNYISELFNWNGTLVCFTEGNAKAGSGTRKMKVFNGTTFETAITLTGGTGLPVRGGVDVIGTDIYFNSMGRIYLYAKIPNTSSYGLYNIRERTDDASSGMLRFFSSAGMHYSSGAGAGYGIRSMISGYGGGLSGAIVSKLKFASLDLPNDKKAKLKSVTVTYQTAVSGGKSFEINTSCDDEGFSTFGATTTVTDLKVQYFKNADGTDLGMFSKIRPWLIFNDGLGSTACPSIERIEYEFELINI